MSGKRIHPSAVVSDGAVLGDGVEIGACAVVGGRVELGAGCVVGPHAVLHDFVRIGSDCRIHAHAVIGDAPQHLLYDGGETWAEIGDRTIIREGVTIHRSMSAGAATRVGSGCFLMAYSHVAHDCVVGDGVILTNNCALAGHVAVGERAVLGGGAMVHQYCRIGPYAMVGGMAGVRKDILPYSMVSGYPARHYGLNKVGLRRGGVRGERYAALEQAFRALRTGKRLPDGLHTEEVDFLRTWLGQRSKRGCSGFARNADGAE
jgi:UDP-N-acetylglucosamine acyltransferase